MLVQNTMGGYDPHFLFLMSNKSGASLKDRVKGLLVFNMESSMVRKPVTDEDKVKVSFLREPKV